MIKRFEPLGETEIIQDKRWAWNLQRICDYMNENFDKIADLEAKLAESEEELKTTKESLYASRKYLDEETSKRWALEKQIEEIEASNINIIQDKEIADIVIAEYKEEVKQIKQQLEESDAYKLRIELAGADETISQLKQQLAEKEKEISLLEEQDGMYHNQLAIEKLKSIRNELPNLIATRTNETFFVDGKKIRDYIDNQINELQ